MTVFSQEGTCHYRGGTDKAISMTYYRLLQGEDEILRTVVEQGPVVVAIDHRTRTFMVCQYACSTALYYHVYTVSLLSKPPIY